jgi:hypothetical protein
MHHVAQTGNATGSRLPPPPQSGLKWKHEGCNFPNSRAAGLSLPGLRAFHADGSSSSLTAEFRQSPRLTGKASRFRQIEAKNHQDSRETIRERKEAG